jgi:hypothetical protein
MYLQAVAPRVTVAGFSVTVERSNSNLALDQLHETLFIDYYFLITITNDGSNQRYRQQFVTPFIISQFTDMVIAPVQSIDGPPIIMLTPDEQLNAILLFERSRTPQEREVVFSVCVKNLHNRETTAQCYAVCQEKS